MDRQACAPAAKRAGVRDWDELILQLKGQLELMFSDAHLAEDGFLLKHIQKNKQHFVSIKLLTCLKQIKVLTDNWYMTLAAALFSPELEVSGDSRKVRRRQAYPEWLLSCPTNKLLMLTNLPPDWLTSCSSDLPGSYASLSGHILTKLASYGAMGCHWLIRPGQELPRDLQRYTKRHRELGRELSVVLKFDTFIALRKAYSDLKAEMESAGKGVRVVSLGNRSASLMKNEQLLEEMSQGDREASTHKLEASRVWTLAEVKEEMEFLPTGDSACNSSVLGRRTQRINVHRPKNKVQVIRQPIRPDSTKGFHHNRKPSA